MGGEMDKQLLAENIIRANVEKCEKQFGHDNNYHQPVQQMRNITLKNITALDVYKIVENYLYTWGRMGRVLGRDKYSGWQKKLAANIRTAQAKLEAFRSCELSAVELSEYQIDIETLYNSLNSIIGPIASAKMLHIICPNFFPLWDNGIADGLRAEYSGVNDLKPFSAQDYFEFMKTIQSLLRKYDELWSSLSKSYNKGKLKIVDECLWYIVRHPFSLIVSS